MKNYTRNEWENEKLHSKRVGKIKNYTRNECRKFQVCEQSTGVKLNYMLGNFQSYLTHFLSMSHWRNVCSIVKKPDGRICPFWIEIDDDYHYDFLTGGKNTLETGGEDVKVHSKRVAKM